MNLKKSMRGLLGAAPQHAFDAMRTEIAQLAERVAAADAKVERMSLAQDEGIARLADRCASLQTEVEHLRHAIEQLRDDAGTMSGNLNGFSQRLDAHDAGTSERLRELEDASRAGMDELRIKLAGVAGQLRWESDDLRKALAAVVARVGGPSSR